MKLLVAIHDVTPALAAECHALWEQCRALEITPALLVVPHWHGWARFSPTAPFTHWVRECESRGAELFLHGLRHDEWESTRALRDIVSAVGRTDFEGEFLSVSRTEASRRIAIGLEQLHACALQPLGFVAPAWLAPAWMPAVAAAQGLWLGENSAAVTAHTGGVTRSVRAPAIRWSGRSPWRAYASAGVARVRRRWHLANPVVRLALHPKDLHHATTRESLARELRWWASLREQVGYAALMRAAGELRAA